MTRIDDTFARLKSQDRKAFVAYIMAGDPDVAAYWHAHTHSDAHVAPVEQGGTPSS